ncbi:MAG TPA: peptide deformylase, partial [Thermodesulfobacteriota bacterium]
MAVLDILHYPNPVLKQKTRPVQKIDASLRKLAQDLAETM